MMDFYDGDYSGKWKNHGSLSKAKEGEVIFKGNATIDLTVISNTKGEQRRNHRKRPRKR